MGAAGVLLDAGKAIHEYPCDDFTTSCRVAGSDGAAARQCAAKGQLVGELQVPAHR